MTVKDVMIICAKLLKNDELTEYLVSNGEYDFDLEKERECYLRAYNLIAEELTCEYFPLVAQERFTPVNGKIKTSAFNKVPLKIKNVISADSGLPVKYRYINDCIAVGDGDVIVFYEHCADEASESKTFPLEPVPGKYVVAFGMAAEICYENGLAGEASVWKSKYDSAIRGRAAERRKLIIKQRKWV